MLDFIVSYWPHAVPDSELESSKNYLQKENYFKEHRCISLENLYDASEENPRDENVREKVRGVTFTPLLLGHVQFGALTSIHLPLIHHELTIRNVTFCAHAIDTHNELTQIGISHFIKLLRKNEHPNEENEMPTLNEEEQQKFKFFNPRFLTAVDWTTDNVPASTSQCCTDST